MSPQEIATLILTIVVIPLTVAVVESLRQYIKAKFTAEQITIVGDVVRTAVFASEQLGLTGAVADKREQALAWASQELGRRGIAVDLATLVAQLEAAVFAQFNFSRTQQPKGEYNIAKNQE